MKKWAAQKSQTYTVPHGELENYVKCSRPTEELVEVHVRRNSCLPAHLKEELGKYCTDMEEWLCGLRPSGIRRLCCQLAIRNSLDISFL
jgi:hypothetical protein